MGQKLIVQKLIIGFELNKEKVKKWMKEHKIKDSIEINEYMQQKFLEILKNPLDCWYPYISSYGNMISGEMHYYLKFNDVQKIKIKDIKITEEMLDIAKKMIKELTDEDIDCPSVDDVPVFSSCLFMYEWQQ